MLRLLRYLWAAPCSAVGLMLGLGALCCGGSARTVSGILEFSLRRDKPLPRFPFAAITFGHIVLGLNEPLLVRCRAHEFEHVKQYERWGLFFFVAYPASGLWQLLRGRNPYWDNHFEVQARQRCKEK